MPKLIVIDHLHVELLVPATASTCEVDVAVRGVRQKKFVDGLRKAVRAVVRENRALRIVSARLAR